VTQRPLVNHRGGYLPDAAAERVGLSLGPRRLPTSQPGRGSRGGGISAGQTGQPGDFGRAVGLARRPRQEGLAVGRRSGKRTVLSLAPEAAAGGWIDLGRGFRLRLAPTGNPGPSPPPTGRRRAWTPKEDALLGKLTDAEVAARTGRTAGAAQVRRLKLGRPALGRKTTARGREPRE
jgi:hypothetical protein